MGKPVTLLEQVAVRHCHSALNRSTWSTKTARNGSSPIKRIGVGIAKLQKLRRRREAAKQGQFLAFLYNYTKIHGRAPAETDLERYFRVSAPAIHDMMKTLERNGLIARTPGKARSIRLLVQPEHLPRFK